MTGGCRRSKAQRTAAVQPVRSLDDLVEPTSTTERTFRRCAIDRNDLGDHRLPSRATARSNFPLQRRGHMLPRCASGLSWMRTGRQGTDPECHSCSPVIGESTRANTMTMLPELGMSENQHPCRPDTCRAPPTLSADQSPELGHTARCLLTAAPRFPPAADDRSSRRPWSVWIGR